MKCEICKKEALENMTFCGKKCSTIRTLREKALDRLLLSEERSFGEGYDSVIKRKWIRSKIESINAGKEDAAMYRLFLWKNVYVD